jgi:hypothetical protein
VNVGLDAARFLRGGPESALAPGRDSRIAEATRAAKNCRGEITPFRRDGFPEFTSVVVIVRAVCAFG